MKRNRFVAVVLSLVLLVSLIGGCTDNSTADSKSKPTSSAQSKPVSSVQSEVIGDTPNEPTSSAQNSSSNINQVREAAKSILGRWYLKGYADVYLDITYEDSQNQYGPYIVVAAENFSFKDNPIYVEPGFYHIRDYTVYPSQYSDKHPNGLSYTPAVSIFLNKWNKTLTEKNIKLDDGVICIDIYEFVRTKGVKTQQNSNTPSEPANSTQPNPSSNAQSNPSSNTQSKPNSSAPSPVHVSSVKISETTISLEVGKTQQLTATVSPSNANNKSVTWTSSNSSVAQVSSAGKVTAKAKGSATITVTTVDGNIKATCKVTVTEAPSASKPVSDVLIISNTQTISDKTIDTDVYITSSGRATFNNVTVNGNVYCYGQLTVSGGSANNLYAYYWDLGGITSSCNAWDGTHGLVKGAFRTCGDIVIKDNALNYAFNKWGKK